MLTGTADFDKPRRGRCERCGRPLVTCLCSLVSPVENRVEVLVLQHPLEQLQAKGTARLLTLSLRCSRLVVGEQFDHEVLQALLHGPSPDGSARQPLLLYPSEAHPHSQATASREPAPTGPPAALRLVVLDGTWRKSRKMLAINPLLQSLPRLSLAEPPPSRYTVRRAEQTQQRSTLEATLLALQQLEGSAEPYEALWTGFDAMVTRLKSQSRTQKPAA